MINLIKNVIELDVNSGQIVKNGEGIEYIIKGASADYAKQEQIVELVKMDDIINTDGHMDLSMLKNASSITMKWEEFSKKYIGVRQLIKK